MPLYQLRLSGTKPRSQPRPKVSRFGGVYFSKSFTKWREETKVAIQTHFDYPVEETPRADTPVKVEIRFYGARKDADADNMSKPILDILQEVDGYFHDDRQVTELHIFKNSEKIKIPMIEITVSWEDQE